MLTSRYAGTPWSAARVCAALVLSAVASSITWTSAGAGDVESTSCIGAWSSLNCVTRYGPAIDPNIRMVPKPVGEAENARFMARDRRWMARCRPTVMHDSYGVPRYLYAARGCEFGAGVD